MEDLHDLLRHLATESNKAIRELKCPKCGKDIPKGTTHHCGITPRVVKLKAIPDDGYADGGEPYTDEELDIINN